MTEEEAIVRIQDLIKNNDFSMAYQEAVSLLDIFPSSSELSFLAGLATAETGDVSMANKLFFRSCELSGHRDYYMILNYIISCMNIGDKSTVVDYINKFYEKLPDNLSDILNESVVEGLGKGLVVVSDIPKQVLINIQNSINDLSLIEAEEKNVKKDNLLAAIDGLGLFAYVIDGNMIGINTSVMTDPVIINSETITDVYIEKSNSDRIMSVSIYYGEYMLSISPDDILFNIIPNDYVKTSRHNSCTMTKLYQDIQDFYQYSIGVDNDDTLLLRYIKLMTCIQSAAFYGISVGPIKSMLEHNFSDLLILK